VVDGIFVVKAEQVRGQFTCLKAGMSAEEVADSRHAEVGVPNQGVNLKTVAGAEDRSLEHLLVTVE
jgi:hypothetical protein